MDAAAAARRLRPDGPFASPADLRAGGGGSLGAKPSVESLLFSQASCSGVNGDAMDWRYTPEDHKQQVLHSSYFELPVLVHVLADLHSIDTIVL